jgi:DNA-binding CsgD family transcriptional regulator/tetratricopeptide (TPR) repeat protein
MQLLERESALASLAGYAQDAERGDGRLVLVAGEAGVGKSALVEQLASGGGGARWLWGACDGLFTPRPLGPLFDLADQLGGELLELGRAGAARDELFRALLRQLSEPVPLTIAVIEDLHWADEASIDLLRFLGRRIRNTHVLLIATYRDDGLAPSDPLRLALGELASQRSTRRIGLAPLSAGAVRVLADGSGIEAAALHRLTGGNPFYVTEVLQAGTGEVPSSARDTVLARAARLSGASRAVLDVAALAGRRVELPLLAAVIPCPPAAVDELLASGLLSGDGDGLKFRHEIARLAVEQSVAAHRAAALHARVLQALGALGGADDARLAFHAEAAGDAAAVLRYAPPAARRAAELASHREAAAQFERALRFEAAADAATRAGLYDSLADELLLLDRSRDAADAWERALGLWRAAGDPLRAGDTQRRLGCALWQLCRRDESTRALEAAVDVLEPLGPSRELAWAYCKLATRRMMDYEHDAAIAGARRAAAMAESLGALDALSDALNTHGCAAGLAGREWSGHLRRALDIALAAGLPAQAGRAYSNLYATHRGRHQFAAAEPYYTDGVAYCDEHDIRYYGIFLRSERTSFLEKAGRWDEALAICNELLSDGGPSPIVRLCPLNRAGMIGARRGGAGVWDLLDEATEYADATGEPQQVVPMRLTRAEARWLEGDLDAARREAELADDRAERCDEWERGAVAVWLRRTGSSRPPRGDVAEPYQRWLEGHHEKAAQLWRDLGCPYEAGLALLGAADEPSLREALRIFTDLGAAPAARIARQRMRAAGIRSIPAGPRAATRADPQRLTRREREVLGLICAGHTNAEIATRLFIAARTVDHHVSAILAKLDTPGREAAAARAAALGLVAAAGV